MNDNVHRYRLRPDLSIQRWGSGEDGRPRLLVRDPVANTLSVVAWPETMLFGGLRRGADIEELARLTAERSVLRPTPAQVMKYVANLGARGLLAGTDFLPARPAPEPPPTARLGRFLAKLLYVRIDLWRPDRFFAATLPFARILVSPPFLVLFLFAALVGLYLCLPRLEGFVAGIVALAQWRNAPRILAVVAAVRLAHEFAHGYAAKAGGARVGGMGVAFFMLMPLPFVDVTDAWRLPRRKRFVVAAAGMAAEAAVAALALPVWALAPPGGGRDAALALATVALFSTLATNLNPGARFDGYFMLSHLLDAENLRQRALGLLHRRWRGLVWGIRRPDPEPGMAPARRFSLTLFAVYAFFYRIALCAGILFLVYRALPGVFGMALAAAALWAFIARPIVLEAAGLWRERKDMTWRAVAAMILFAAFLAWMGLDLPRRAVLPAVARHRETPILVRRSGELAETRGSLGDEVVPGLPLARVRRAEVDAEIDRAMWAAEEARREEEIAMLSPGARGLLTHRRARSALMREASRAWRTREEMSDISVAEAGVICVWHPWVRSGVYVGRGETLGWVRHSGLPRIAALADMALARRLEPGAEVWFVPDDGGEGVRGILVRIETNRLDVLEDAALAQAASARREGGEWRLPGPMLRVVAELEKDLPRSGQTGRLVLRTRPYSLFGEAWAWIAGLALRESGV